MTAPRTLYDKIWDQHVVHVQGDGRALLYIDRHIIHEVSSAQAFQRLRQNGRTLRRPELCLATTDHIVPTAPREEMSSADDYFGDPKVRKMCNALERNVKEHGLKFFGINDKRQGIVHIIAPEQGFILPGTTCVCGDSHTSTHGAFGALAFGIGTSEIEHVLATQTLLQKKSKNMRVTINGDLHDGVTSKDVILYIIGQIGIAGGTGCVIEYSGSVFSNFSMEERMSVCNMSIEAGARAGLIAPDETTLQYLKGRAFAPESGESWGQAEAYWRKLHTDDGAYFDKEITIHGHEIAPSVTWGTLPQDVVPITGRVPYPDSFPDAQRQRSAVRSLEYMGLNPGILVQDIAIDKVFIGSCTNGRMEDLRSVATVISAAGFGAHVAQGVYAMIVPGSGIVRQQAEAEGLDIIFKRAGFDWREAGCSMCCGLNQDRLKPQERCASTSNRNFEGRQGSGGRTHLMSPAMAAAAALNGNLTDVRKYGVSVRPAKSVGTPVLEQVGVMEKQVEGSLPPAASDHAAREMSQPTSLEKSTEKQFRVLKGIAAPLERENIDTDVIIAVPFLTGTTRTGYGQYLFHSLRFDPKTGEMTDFVLNREPYTKSCIIVCTGANFGCGSSREAAPWSLKEFGIKCIIAPSFAEIFENNCFNNGMLPIALPKEICETLHGDASKGLPLEVDLEKQEIRREDGGSVKFQTDPFRRDCLLAGFDEIGLSLQKLGFIEEFEKRRAARFEWMDRRLFHAVSLMERGSKNDGNLEW